MTEMSYAGLIEDLAAVFDGKPMSDRKIELYARHLEVIPLEHLAIVIERIIDTHQSGFVPSIGDIKQAYVDLLLGPADPDGALQWCLSEQRRQRDEAEMRYWSQDVLTRGVFQHKPELPASFPDPVTAETVRLYGWQRIAETEREFLAPTWAKTYGQARANVSTRIQSGDTRLQLPATGARALRAVS